MDTLKFIYDSTATLLDAFTKDSNFVNKFHVLIPSKPTSSFWLKEYWPIFAALLTVIGTHVLTLRREATKQLNSLRSYFSYYLSLLADLPSFLQEEANLAETFRNTLNMDMSGKSISSKEDSTLFEISKLNRDRLVEYLSLVNAPVIFHQFHKDSLKAFSTAFHARILANELFLKIEERLTSYFRDFSSLESKVSSIRYDWYHSNPAAVFNDIHYNYIGSILQRYNQQQGTTNILYCYNLLIVPLRNYIEIINVPPYNKYLDQLLILCNDAEGIAINYDSYKSFLLDYYSDYIQILNSASTAINLHLHVLSDAALLDSFSGNICSAISWKLQKLILEIKNHN